MSDITLHRNRFILLGCLFLALSLTACAATGEVKGGGTIIGNPNLPTLPAVPKEQHEDPLEQHEEPLEQDRSELTADIKLRRFLWPRFLPAARPLPTDPFAPILTQIGTVRRNLNSVYDVYFQNYLWGNLLAGLDFSKFATYQKEKK